MDDRGSGVSIQAAFPAMTLLLSADVLKLSLHISATADTSSSQAEWRQKSLSADL